MWAGKNNNSSLLSTMNPGEKYQIGVNRQTRKRVSEQTLCPNEPSAPWLESAAAGGGAGDGSFEQSIPESGTVQPARSSPGRLRRCCVFNKTWAMERVSWARRLISRSWLVELVTWISVWALTSKATPAISLFLCTLQALRERTTAGAKIVWMSSLTRRGMRKISSIPLAPPPPPPAGIHKRLLRTRSTNTKI